MNSKENSLNNPTIHPIDSHDRGVESINPEYSLNNILNDIKNDDNKMNLWNRIKNWAKKLLRHCIDRR